MKVSDFRSDTVTRPTPEMLEAMVRAEVGDDLLGDDPTVKRLEALAAERTGKEAALFLVSGTMANQVAAAVWCRPGDEVILEEGSHPIHFESGALARIAGVQIRPIPGSRGAMDPGDVERAVRPDKPWHPRSSLVVVEQTHLGSGGSVLPLENLRGIREVAARKRLRVHVDGARLFNAVVASGIPASAHAECADSITFSLSKGLCCPVGSLLCGPAPFVSEARRVRKALGGGWRQAGYLAAAGIYALERMVERLAEDHALAKGLAAGLAQTPGLEVDPSGVETNVVFVRVRHPMGPDRFVKGLEERGVRASAYTLDVVRFVTHRDVGPADAERAIREVAHVLSGRG
ncbi:MAG TPA: GntG family PLP-dependent aldolase [Planctomycetota bacterium]|nr:GntG family PLP-dependent aldolase [Planctomycetota bacterium]